MTNKIMRHLGISLFLFFIISSNVKVFAKTNTRIDFQVEKYQLKNGLTVLLHQDRTTPQVSYQQWFRVGSSHEKPGRTGLAHFFEHLMFKGTVKYPKGTIDRLIEKNGGDKNAFTSEDVTAYYTDLPSDQLELIIDVESDRMRELLFDPKEIDSEREVVKEERRMRYDNNVYGSLYEQIRSVMYKTSPYRWPVIGYMADLNAAQLSEFKEFYQTYYAPNNAVVIVAGDIDIERTKKLIEKYYGSMPSQKIPDFNPTAEVVQKAPRRAVLERDVDSVTTAVVYPGAKMSHPDVHALDVLTSILGAGTSSRLYKKHVYESGLATQVSASSSNDKLAGDITFLLMMKPGQSSDRALNLLNEQIIKIQNHAVEGVELAKVKKSIKLSYLKGLQTISSRAHALANAEVLDGDYRKLFQDLEKYEQVTAEDILRVAKNYLNPQKQNIIQVVPKK